MDSRVYWSFILYSAASYILLAPLDGWQDALGLVLWLALTIYFAYNMQWTGYGRHHVRVRGVEENKKGEATVHVSVKRRDWLEDACPHIVGLVFIGIAQLLGITLIIVLSVSSFALMIYVAVNLADWLRSRRARYYKARARLWLERMRIM